MKLEEKNKIIEDLYFRKIKSVKGYCLRFVPFHEVEDLSQDIFISLFNSLDKFRNECNIDTYLYFITRSVCLNYCREKNSLKRKHIEISIDKINEDVIKNNYNINFVKYLNDKKAKSPLENLMYKQYFEFINEQYKKLPKVHQKCFYEFCNLESNLSCLDIGKKMKISNGTVKTRIYRARKILKKKFKEKFGNPAIV